MDPVVIGRKAWSCRARVGFIRSAARRQLPSLGAWPHSKQGEAHEQSRRGCREVLKDGVPRQIAGDAFIRAAEEAGIHIRKK